MQFAFKNNNRKFVEGITLTFNQDKKIDNISFGLSNTAFDDIMKKDVWSQDARLILVNFLEEYRTAELHSDKKRNDRI